MRIYENILANLTDSQKLHILTDLEYLSTPACAELGIPSVRVGRMKDYLRELYPHATAQVHAWDEALWRDVAAERFRAMREDGVGFSIVAGARIKLSPYRKELSEDPYLAAAFSAAQQSCVTDAQAMCGVSGCYLTNSDLLFLDDEPQQRVIHEYVTKPYIDSVQRGGAQAVISDGRALKARYGEVNLSIQKEAIRDGKLLICERATDETTVACLASGGICLHGSYVALDRACKQYKKMKKSVEEGTLTVTEFEQAVSDCVIISPDAVDDATDRVLAFAFACQAAEVSSLPAQQAQEDVAYRATLESTVLLKNKNEILPLKAGCRVALIGDFAYQTRIEDKALIEQVQKLLAERGIECIGCARGYHFENDDGEDALSEMLSLAEKADAVIFFAGFGAQRARELHHREKLTLPANQLRVADVLARYGEKVVTVLESGHSVDVEFTRPFAGVLLSVLDVRYGAAALCQILSGAFSPCGRLAYTLYAGSEHAFAKQRYYKTKMHMKSGPFIGYRYYDTAQMQIGYPFGHGLSYGDVEYSACSVQNGKVTFTVENLGDREICEVAQIYAGIEKSEWIRPKKELCGYARISLGAYEKKTVTVAISLPTVYLNGAYVTERGSYRIEVGRSVSDIRLTSQMTGGTHELSSDGERLSDYLQSVSNITDGKYTLEAKYSRMKKPLKNLLFGIGALVLAISIGVFNSVTEQASGFLVGIALILAAAGVLFFLLHSKERAAAHEAERQSIEQKNAEHFENAEQISFAAAQKIFKQEFEEEDDTDEQTSAKAQITPNEEYLFYANKNLLFAQAASEFCRFAEERGYRFDKHTAENIFASLASSRLILTQPMDGADFRAMMLLLGEYFETKTYLDVVDDTYVSEFSAFFGYDANHAFVNRNLTSALMDAREAVDKIHIVALDAVKVASLSDYFKVFIPYIKNPYANGSVSVRNERDAEVRYPMYGNVWFILNPERLQTVADLPASLLPMATALSVVYEACEAKEEHTVVEKFSHYQMRYLVEQLTKTVVLPEDGWKKIDKLEAYVRARADYRIGNKLWLGMERHMMVLTACEIDQADAFDEAVRSTVLPSVICALRGAEPQEDAVSVSEVLDIVFGEDSMPSCTAFAKQIAAIAAQKVMEETEQEKTDMTEEVVEETVEVTAEETVEPVEEAEVTEETAEETVEPVEEAEEVEEIIQEEAEETSSDENEN